MSDTAPDWLEEVSFDATRPWLQMGTKALGAQPWLIFDDNRDAELAEKRRLLDEQHVDVFGVVDDAELASGPADVNLEDSVTAGRELFDLVCREVEARELGSSDAAKLEMSDGLHPLDEAGRIVQEDLCLLRRRPSGRDATGPVRWCLDAASLCFPSRWRLADKLGLPMGAVHGPVAGYDPALVDRVDSLLNALADGPPDRVVRRRNWFVHPDASLFQPDRPASEPVIPADRANDELFVRSERQTLRALPCGWIVFTIKIQQAALGVALEKPAHREAFERSLRVADAADLAHHGLPAAQVAALV